MLYTHIHTPRCMCAHAHTQVHMYQCAHVCSHKNVPNHTHELTHIVMPVASTSTLHIHSRMNSHTVIPTHTLRIGHMPHSVHTYVLTCVPTVTHELTYMVTCCMCHARLHMSPPSHVCPSTAHHTRAHTSAVTHTLRPTHREKWTSQTPQLAAKRTSELACCLQASQGLSRQQRARYVGATQRSYVSPRAQSRASMK